MLYTLVPFPTTWCCIYDNNEIVNCSFFAEFQEHCVCVCVNATSHNAFNEIPQQTVISCHLFTASEGYCKRQNVVWIVRIYNEPDSRVARSLQEVT